ncbi:MAG: hypothetical protein GF347_00090 [Candidatus Moranbacteria bacterium]|nr:hypothetical protein [Candidatus Moranbacteria bacterium]
MYSLVLDIETFGENYDKMDKKTKEALTYWIERESLSETEYKKNIDKVKDRLALSPYTGKIVSIALLNPETSRGAVYFQAPKIKIKPYEKKGVKFICGTEKELLENFWQTAEKYNEFVTFNGQGFDIPYLIIRSAVNKVKPSKNLMSNRYYRSQDPKAKHVDLMDQLTFYGAVYSRPNLHLVCRAFGVKSPKEEDISGQDVAKLFKLGQYKKIAEYNLRDVIATAELYKRWKEFIKFEY